MDSVIGSGTHTKSITINVAEVREIMLLVMNSAGYYNGFNMLPVSVLVNGIVLECRSIIQPEYYTGRLTYHGNNNFTLECYENAYVKAIVYTR